jgi:serine/threonine protein kinase
MDAPDEAVGQTLGRYMLLEKIGEGGCGVVYVAEQTEPVRRRVALKVIKLGMDTKQVVARFEAERQALAMMDHPNIAKVLDAGTTESSRWSRISNYKVELSDSWRPPLLRDGTGARHPHHRLLRPGQSQHQGTA